MAYSYDILQKAKLILQPTFDIYQGCGKKKGCFGLPANCISQKNCELVTSYTTDKTVGKVTFEIFTSKAVGGNFYAAVAFGEEPKMVIKRLM